MTSNEDAADPGDFRPVAGSPSLTAGATDDKWPPTCAIPAEIEAERARQIADEGWTSEGDDRHEDGELLAVATMYWQRAIGVPLPMRQVLAHPERAVDGTWTRASLEWVSVPVAWPWEPSRWKPRSQRRDLERAGGLCLAEIDRLKRRRRPVAHVEHQLAMIVQAYNGLPRAGARP